MTESMMGKLYEEIKKNSSIDAEAESLWRELIERALVYTGIRVFGHAHPGRKSQSGR